MVEYAPVKVIPKDLGSNFFAKISNVFFYFYKTSVYVFSG